MIPKTIQILGREYKIRRRRMKDYAGVDPDARIIWIRSGVNDETARECLLHEVLHAILHQSGNNYQLDAKQEEAIVRSIEHGLTQAGYGLHVE